MYLAPVSIVSNQTPTLRIHFKRAVLYPSAVHFLHLSISPSLSVPVSPVEFYIYTNDLKVGARCHHKHQFKLGPPSVYPFPFSLHASHIHCASTSASQSNSPRTTKLTYTVGAPQTRPFSLHILLAPEPPPAHNIFFPHLTMSPPSIPPPTYAAPGLHAARPLPDTPSERHLGAMFTAIVASLDMPSRRALAEVVEHCHTRGPHVDPRQTPVLFFNERDEVTQTVAASHLGDIAKKAVARKTQVNPDGLLSEGLEEQNIVACLNEQERKQYLLERFYSHKRECMELGYRYLGHLERPDLPLEQTIRPLPIVDYDETRHIIAANDSEEEWSDEDMFYSDEEESFCSQISDVTYECETVSTSKQHLTDSTPVRKEESFEVVLRDAPSQ